MNERYLDCYARLEGDQLIVGNDFIERAFKADLNGLAPWKLTDKRYCHVWQRDEGNRLIPLPFHAAALTAEARVDDHGGLSDPFLTAQLTWSDGVGGTLTRSFSIFPQSPFVTMNMFAKDIGVYMPEASSAAAANGNENKMIASKTALTDCIDLFPLPQGHYKLHTALLADKTDINDTLVRESVRQIYSGGWANESDNGSLFMVDDYLNDRAFLIVKEAPCNWSELNRTESDLHFQHGVVAQLVGSGLRGADTADGAFGYGSTVGVGRRSELMRAWRDHYRKLWKNGGSARIMSNTWGDRNQDRAVCHDFMMAEIEKAAYLGVDVVQIDDGWQHGRTVNSALSKTGVWEGYYRADPHFWQVDETKFPQGLKPLVQKAHENGIEVGLWFSPDSTNDFLNWYRDADTLLNLWRQENIRHFKLDGVKIRSKQGERNYLRLLERLCRESNGQIRIYQDITAQIRLGCIYFRQYGRLFVENRYTDTTAYYPYRTLKNAWQISRYVPLDRFQFEVLNPRRNKERYPKADALRPDTYDMDTLFAIVMLSSPLVWMEMSHLNDEDSLTMKKLIAVYRRCRDDFAMGDVSPVGEMPDGTSLTGFKVDCGNHGYLLLIRETTGRNCFAGMMPENASVRVLYSNAQAALDAARNEIILDRPRSFVLLAYENV